MIVITGANGFIGKYLIRQCKNQKIEYKAIDLLQSNEDNYYTADILSYDIEKYIPYGCDAIIHLAGLSRDKDCKDNGYNCFNVNVMGTLNLMRVAHNKKVKQFIFASSEWVYDTFDKNEIKDEESTINIANHTSEYALSKLVSESNLRQKYQHEFCNVTILRFGIVYGLRKENWSAVEAIYNEVKTKDLVTVGSLKTGRCFIHVADIVDGIIKSIGLKDFHIINLQGNQLTTLNDIIDTSKSILSKNPSLIEKNPDNFSIRNISNKKAKELLGWKPKIELQKGLLLIDKALKTG